MKNAIGVMGLLIFSSVVHAAGAPANSARGVINVAVTTPKGKGVPATTVAFDENKAALPPIWTGFYGGINAAALYNHVDLQSHQDGLTRIDGTCDVSTNFASFSPGVQLGYAHEYNSRVVLGLEGDVNYNTSQTGHLSCTCPITPGVSDSFSFYNRAQASLLGRIGYALYDNRLLPFVTAGGSLASLGLKYSNENGDYYTNSYTTQAGWLVGAGVEWKMAAAWSLRAEYDYTAYSDVNLSITKVYGLIDPDGAAHASLYTNTVKLALNYWFY